LAAVIGIGVSVPAGTLSTIYRNTGSAYGMNNMYGKCAAWSDIGNFERGTNFSMNLGFLMSTFLVPAVLLFFPLVALLMQVKYTLALISKKDHLFEKDVCFLRNLKLYIFFKRVCLLS
jgi:hypothetical protein